MATSVFLAGESFFSKWLKGRSQNSKALSIWKKNFPVSFWDGIRTVFFATRMWKRLREGSTHENTISDVFATQEFARIRQKSSNLHEFHL